MTKRWTTKSRLKRLEELRTAVGEQIYEAVGHSKECFADKDFVDEFYEGDEVRAEAGMRAGYFTYIEGWTTLFELWKAHDIFPAAVWKEHHYNLRVLIDLMREETFKSEPAPSAKADRPRYKEQVEQLTEAIEQERFQRKREEDQRKREEEYAVSWRQKCEELEAELAEVKTENAELRGRLKELERLLDTQRVA